MLVAALALAAVLEPAPPVPPPPSPATLDLRWTAPASCPTADEIRQRYLAMLSAPPAGLGTMVVDARVDNHGTRWTLLLVTHFDGGADERTLEAPSCAALADATAMLLAVALEPGLASSSSTAEAPATEPLVEPLVEPVVEQAMEPVMDPLVEPVVEPAPIPSRRATGGDRRPARKAQGVVRPFAGVEYGAVPGVAAYLGVAGGAVLPRARFEFDVAWLSPRRRAGPRSSSVRVQGFVGAAHACLRLRWAVVEFPICGGLEGGLMRATATGVPNAKPALGPWLGPSSRFAVAYARGRWGVFGSIGVALRAWGTRLRIDDAIVFTPALASIRVAVGLEVFF